MATEPPFTRVYFDTEPLRRSMWPNISAAIERLLLSARLALPAITVHLPLAVERELEAQFVRDYQAARRSLTISASSTLNDLLKRAGLNKFIINGVPDEGATRTAFRERVAETKGRWDLGSVRLPQRSIEEIFAMRLARQAPFNAKGDGLGDVLICHSVIDDLRSNRGAVGVLVTADTDYKGLKEVAVAHDVRLISMTIEETTESIESRFNADVRRFISEQREQARAAVEANREQLTTFVREHLEIDPETLVSFTETLEQVDALNRVQIEHVSVSPDFETLNAGDPVTLTAQLSIFFHVTIQIIPKAPPRRIRIGENLSLGAFKSGFQGAAMVSEEVRVRAEATATARRTPNGYDEVVWTAVTQKQYPASLEALLDAK